VDGTPPPETDLGTAIGAGVVTGSTADTYDYLTISCALGADGASDELFTWAAPCTGVFTFELVGSDFNPALEIRDTSCSGALRACNDDLLPPTNLEASITLELTTGDALFIVVTGYSDEFGSYQLDIAAPADCLSSG
jgi:hypothetical protein